MESKEFLILNPLLYNEAKKYIWINDSQEEYLSAQQMFGYLLKNQIYVEGFATDVSYLENLKMYNKQIIGINEFDYKNAYIFFDSYCYDKESRVGGDGHRARIINPVMGKKNVIIWGAGVTGEVVCKILTENGIKPKYFVDSNKYLEGGIKCDIPIYMPDKLDDEVESFTLIEALENWQQVDKIVESKCSERFHFSLNEKIWNQWKYHSTYIGVNIDGIEKSILGMHEFYIFSDKKVYIYGTGAVEREFAKYLVALGYDFRGFLVDEIDYEDSGDLGKYSVMFIEEILYETSYFIWIYDNEKCKKLNELGLKYYIDYIGYILYDADLSIGRDTRLDINLGYNYIVDEKHPGFMTYGTINEKNYKIVVLGGSTSDGAMYPFASWPKLLYDELNRNDITVYNGGVCGYTSGQELIKLIRDSLPLDPDMIIVYDGFNEYSVNEQYPFRFDYARKVFDYAKEHLADEWVRMDSSVCSGIVQQRGVLDYWFSNIQSMHAIAEDRKIRFFSFAQPMLTSKEMKTMQEKNMLISWDVNALCKWTSTPLRSFMKKQDMPDYMYDLSHIFDGEEGVYMDPCHVWEKGNRIIAREIKKIILPALDKA